MITLNDELLVELGLGDLAAPDRASLLAHIYETLETRVGMTLARRMSEEQITEFEALIDNDDQAGAIAWLQLNQPDYPEVVRHHLEVLKAEITNQAEAIVGAAQEPQARMGSRGGPAAGT